jgi:hypothetical protein
VKSIEWPSIGNKRRAVGLLEYLPDGSLVALWICGLTGMGNAPVQQSGVELIVALEPQQSDLQRGSIFQYCRQR